MAGPAFEERSEKRGIRRIGFEFAPLDLVCQFDEFFVDPRAAAELSLPADDQVPMNSFTDWGGWSRRCGRSPGPDDDCVVHRRSSTFIPQKLPKKWKDRLVLSLSYLNHWRSLRISEKYLESTS